MDVQIIAGSKSDQNIVEKVESVLKGRVDYGVEYCSFHREPERLDGIVKKSKAKLFVCIAGLSAALPGAVAAMTDKPVIGVPVSAKLGGVDALLSIAQMPRGVPVACVGIDSGENAGLLALRILGKK
ncbi:MAG: AIR carboxylase family protein [Candidatus Altiarchaeota archaeon]